VLGFPLVVSAHQGRGAESVFFGAVIDPGEIVPSNAHFDTTRAHIEVREGIALDLPVAAALDPDIDAPFKGDMDTARLEELVLEEQGAAILKPVRGHAVYLSAGRMLPEIPVGRFPAQGSRARSTWPGACAASKSARSWRAATRRAGRTACHRSSSCASPSRVASTARASPSRPGTRTPTSSPARARCAASR
jgi:hypothetical protein